MLSKLYILRFNELDEAQRFRFRASFLVAIYMMLLAPIVHKYSGIFFSTQLITILMVVNNLSVKFFEPITKRFIIGQIYHAVIWMQVAELLVLLLYFYNFKLMIYVYVFLNIIITILTGAYGIKLTSLQAKVNPEDIKKISIFRANVWAEGYVVGLCISLMLQSFGLTATIIGAIVLRAIILVYMASNWDFFDKYFSKPRN